ncbi:MAG: hypothetical protein AAGA56_10720 [Myxococcota bacterium]
MPRSTKAEPKGPPTLSVSGDGASPASNHVKRYPVTDLAARTGRIVHERVVGVVPNWEHRAAATLHGWDLHAHHAGRPLELSLDDYEAAISAASAARPPHAAAVSPHRRRPLNPKP